MENTGVILGERRGDWRAGGPETKIVYKEELPSGDWTPYLPPGEWQRFENALDVMACVTFSALNVLETLYYFHTGKRKNFSDRFTATMSGTTMQGNYLFKVGDSIRNDGLVDEADWPKPEFLSGEDPWKTYYQAIQVAVIDKGREFWAKECLQPNNEFIDFSKESLIHHLKQAPIQVVFPSHAVMLFTTTEQVYRYFDTYDPFVKDRQDGFVSAMKYVLTKKTMFELWQAEGGDDVYLVRDGKKTLFRGPTTFSLIGDWSNIKKVPQAQLDSLPEHHPGHELSLTIKE